MPNRITKMFLIIPAMVRAALDGTNHTFWGASNAVSIKRSIPLHEGDASVEELVQWDAENATDFLSLPDSNGTYCSFSNSSAYYRLKPSPDGASFNQRIWGNGIKPCNITFISPPSDSVIAGTVIEIKKPGNGSGIALPRACKEVNYGKLLALVGTSLHPTEDVHCFERWIVDQLERICDEDINETYSIFLRTFIFSLSLIGIFVMDHCLRNCSRPRPPSGSIRLFDTSRQPLLQQDGSTSTLAPAPSV